MPSVPDENKDVCEAIGRFIMCFAELEFVLHWTICAVVKPAAGEEEIRGATDYSAKCALVERLLETVPRGQTAPQKEVRRFVEDCKSISEVRNILAHGFWTPEGIEHASRRRLIPKLHFMPVSTLETHIEELNRLREVGLNLYVLYSPDGPLKACAESGEASPS